MRARSGAGRAVSTLNRRLNGRRAARLDTDHPALRKGYHSQVHRVQPEGMIRRLVQHSVILFVENWLWFLTGTVALSEMGARCERGVLHRSRD